MTLVTSCSVNRPPGATIAERVPGCYELQAGAWELDPLIRRFADPDLIPRRFELLATRADEWDAIQTDTLPYLAVHAVPQRYFSTWRRIRTDTDSIMVGTPLPLAGAMLRVSLEGRRLEGNILTFTDAIPEDNVSRAIAPITAIRIQCKR